MASLGKFGVDREPVDVTFDWFDQEVRVHPDLSDLSVIGVFAAMQDQEDGAAALKALGDLAAVIVHPDDLEAFWATARAHRQTMEDVATLAMQLVGALAERPTLRPGDSSDGSQPTEASSEAVSSLPALRALAGRPDLQVAVLRAEKSA